MDKTMSSNPLSQYFRQPAIYLKLPSQGRYWPEDALELPITKEIPIYPMTAKDEITLRTPDALMNGQGMIDLIQSCCPNIKNAWDMPSIDVDAVVIAIRIASYGQTMDFDNRCPHCNHENTHGIDLTSILDRIRCPDYTRPIEVNEHIKIRIRPQPYFSVNATNRTQFEEQQLLRMISTMEDGDEKLEKFNQQMMRLVDLNIKLVTDSTEYIEVDQDQRVTDKTFIEEFYRNTEASTLKTLQQKVTDLAQQGAIPESHVICGECQKDYSVAITFDYSNFFGEGF